MTIAKEFVAASVITRETPSGGTYTVAPGCVITQDDKQLSAIYNKLVDEHGDVIFEYALTTDTFGLILQSMMEVLQPYSELSELKKDQHESGEDNIQ